MSGEPHIRKVRPEELEEVWRVHVAASNDLVVRRGRPAPRPADAPVASDARAGLASDPDGYFCAVEEGRIRGMVSALVRGRVWYLSMFFVLPGDQGRGVGRALLEQALAYGESRGAEVRCTWATLDPRAQARYVMAGMAPRWPIYRLEGDAAAVARLRARVGLDARERELPCDPGAAEKLIAEVFGHGRAATWPTGGATPPRRWRSSAAASSLPSPIGGGSGSGRRRDATRRRSSGRWRRPQTRAAGET